VLALTFECRDKAGLLGNDPQSARKSFWPIGVLAAPTLGAQALEPAAQTDCSRITAAVVIGQKRTKVRIESDTTHGLLTTGTLLLALSDIKPSPERLTIELSLPNGFSRPPRLLRIEPNVIPIRQVQTVEHEEETANGLPDWTFSIGVQPLLFATGAEPITVKVAESSEVKIWQRRDRISDEGPDDNVYEFDTESGQITFGNGINGRIPPAGSKVAVTFAVSDGGEGRVARNRKWNVAGFAETFGVNLDPIGGGTSASGSIEDRREARLRSREDHALISSDDIAAAAKSLPLLEVARAWVPAPPTNAPRTGVVTLVVMRSRPGGVEPELPPETTQWLKAISRRLLDRMPLGSRLSVVAPRYSEFTIDAVLEADPGRKPAAIAEEIEKELKKRLALVESPGVSPRQAGVPVTSRDIAAWIRAIDGVRRVVQLKLRDSDGQLADKVAVPRTGLPRWIAGSSNNIEVKRPEPGRSR
jgi:predicted phage baseplate assembly protein